MFMRLLETVGRNVKMKSLSVERQTKNQTLWLITPTLLDYCDQARASKGPPEKARLRVPIALLHKEEKWCPVKAKARNKVVLGEKSREELHISPSAHSPQRVACFCQNILQWQSQSQISQQLGWMYTQRLCESKEIRRKSKQEKSKSQTSHGTNFLGESSAGWAQGEIS